MSSQSPDLSAASLYCGEDAGDVVSCDADQWISDHPTSLSHSPPPSSDEDTIARLIDCESHHMPNSDYLQRCRDRSIDVTARQDSITWILKVHAYYRFRPVTAVLSVNFLDRFLSSHSLPKSNSNGSWPFQLLSVACLSLAAKMEETHVPLLLDLQVFEPRFVFESKTVQRMELWVMANLNWRLRSVTPFDYLDYFISKLPSSSRTELFNRVFSASSDLILNTTRVIDFLGFSPSAVAAAAALCASGVVVDFSASDDRSPVFFHERVNKDMVRSCHQLMENYLIDTCPLVKEREAEPPAAPPSPVGVLDAAACGSCDMRSQNPGSSNNTEPPPKKRVRSSAPDVQQP